MMKVSFTLRVLIINFFLLALPLLIDSFIFFQRSYRESTRQAENQLRQLANFRTVALSQTVPLSHTLVRELEFFLQREKKQNNFTEEALTAKFTQMARGSNSFQVFLLQPEGNEKYRTFATSLPRYYEKTYRDYALAAKLEKSAEISFIRYHYKPIFEVYDLFLIVAKTFEDYVLMAAFDIQSEMETILQQVKNNEKINFAFLNADGVVFASTLPSLEGHYFDNLDAWKRNEILKSDDLGKIKLADKPLPQIRGDNPLFFDFIFNDEVQIAYRSYIPGFGASIVAFSSKEALFGRAISRFLILYVMYAVILILGAIVTYWLSQWISKPLNQLSDAMTEVSRGNLAVRFKEEPLGFEINLLGRIFNNTLDTLLEHIDQAENERVKKETYERKIAIARSVQQNLLPAFTPKIEHAEIAGAYIPAKDVGGDFYNYFTKTTKDGEEVLYFGVADAAGKGISSALYALSFRSLMIAYSHLYDDVGEALSRTNNAFLEEAADSGMFLSVIQGSFKPKWKILSYYSCGNIPGIVRRANGHLVVLEHSGVAIGLQPSSGYVPDHIQLYAGDLVVFFTEGLIESTDENNQPFSISRLKELLQKRNWKTAQDAVSAIVSAVQEFTKGKVQEQEATLVALKMKEEGG